jgi:hypothetical protein
MPIKLRQLVPSPSASEAWADRASTSMEIVWSLRDESTPYAAATTGRKVVP